MKTPVRLLVVWLAISGSAFAQTTLNLSQDLVRLGIAATNMVPNQPGLDVTQLFLRGVGYATNHKIPRIIADKGGYYFRSLEGPAVHAALGSLSNFVIDFQGSDIYFTSPLVQGFLVTNGTNLVLQNFTADYDPLPFTQVRVVSVDTAQRKIQFAVDGSWQNPTALNAVFAVAPNVYGRGVEMHFFRSGRPVPNLPRMYAANPLGSNQLTIANTTGPNVPPSAALLSQIRPGDIVFLGMRYGSGPVSVLYCTGCTFRNITVYSGTEWGFQAGHTQSSVFERIYSIPRPGTDRLVSNFLGIWLPDAGPGNQLRLNRVIRTMDCSLEYDSVFLATVKSQTDSRTVVLEGTITTLLEYGLSLPNGSPLAFQRLSDGAILGSAAIASQTAPQNTGQSYVSTVTFDRDLPSGVAGTLAFALDPNQRNANSVIENNALEEETDCCTGFSIGGPTSSVIRGNYLQRSGMDALHTENSLQPGNIDNPPSVNYSVTNNVIDGANWALTGYPALQLGSIDIQTTNAGRVLTASPHENVSITNNFIADSGTSAVWLGNTTRGSVSGNYLLDSNSNAAVQSSTSSYETAQPLIVQASQNIATGNNIVDQTSRRMWITDGQYRELAAYAPGLTIRLNAFNLGSLVPHAVTLTDATGNAQTVTAQSVTAHAIDVQIPASASLGGAYLTLTSGTLKYFGTLFLDSVDNVPAVNGCTYKVSLSSTTVGVTAGSLPILVVSQTGCSYQVLDTDSFVTPGAGGTGTSVTSVGFAAASGTRSTTIEVAAQAFTVTQTPQADQGPSTRFVLPQLAFGGGWYTALYFSNTGSTAVSFTVSFIGDNGAPLNVPSVGGSSATVNIAPRGTAVIEAPNAGPLNQGYVSLSLPNGVVGYGVFRQSLEGFPDQEAVVPLTGTSSTGSTLIWDERIVTTAVAIVNPSSAAVTVAVTLWDDNGNVAGTSSVNLAANNKTALYMRTLPGLAGMAGKKGSAQFTVATGNVSVLGLRFDGPAFTSIPTTQQ